MPDCPLVMGILNVTPDSFSDGGLYTDVQKAVDAARCMITEGARIIDIGGESTRPGYPVVSVDEELKRVLPVIKELKNDGILLSIDTQKPEVAQKAIQAGAHIINNISSLCNQIMAPLAAKLNCPLVLTSNQTEDEKIMEDAVAEVLYDLQNMLQFALQSGVKRENIILDVGLGFGKTPEQNLLLIKNLVKFKEIGYPLLAGASRKSFIGFFSPETRVDQRLGGSLAAALTAVQNGADIVRVHDVAATVQALKIIKAIENS